MTDGETSSFSGEQLSWIRRGIDIGDGDALMKKMDLGDVIGQKIALCGGHRNGPVALKHLRFENA